MRQEVTRAHKGWSLDSVMLYNDVTKVSREDITAPPAVSITYSPKVRLDLDLSQCMVGLLIEI